VDSVAPGPVWSLSVVSHGHGASIARLLDDCARHLDPKRVEICVTLNQPREPEVVPGAWRGAFRLLRNEAPRGFAANHNQALALAGGEFVAAIDPDLRLAADPFSALERHLPAMPPRIAAVEVCDARGAPQDNARRLVTPLSLVRRHLLGRSDAYLSPATTLPVEWTAGLFMAMRRRHFEALGGFDERYHLYCEDAELCLRCWNEGGDVWVVPFKGVTHDARRRTLRSLSHLRWHLRSLVTLWLSSTYRRYRQRQVRP
jgi:N-acetylglucosaminyl-diphospho-decaprenol L-rhamnosyltransferase